MGKTYHSAHQEGSTPRWLVISLFCAVFLLINAGYLNLRGSWLEPLLVDKITVAPVQFFASIVFPADGVRAEAGHIEWLHGRLSLLNGCDGFELMTLLCAAILVAPISLSRGLLALSGGVLFIWCLNQARILTLYWAFRYHRDWFDALHTLWMPLALMIMTVLYFFKVVLHGSRLIDARDRDAP